MKRTLSFLESDFEFTYIQGFDPSDEFLYQIKVPLFTEPKPRSEELLDDLFYKVAAQLSEEEQEDLMDTSKPPAPLHISE